MAALDSSATLAKLRTLLARDGTNRFSRIPRPERPRPASIREASAELGVPKSTLHDLAREHQLERRQPKSAADRRTFEQLDRQAKLSLSKIAALIGIAKGTASNWRRQRLDRGAAFKPRRLKTAKLCPGCGHRVVVWPCVACNTGEVVTKEW